MSLIELAIIGFDWIIKTSTHTDQLKTKSLAGSERWLDTIQISQQA